MQLLHRLTARRVAPVVVCAAAALAVGTPFLARFAGAWAGRPPAVVPVASDNAAEPAETPVRTVAESHPGFDTNVYPGDRAMRAWRAAGTYEWVGYYLPAPCHKDVTWSGKRETLESMGWGVAVIYVGQQTWEGVHRSRVRHRGESSCDRSLLGAERGRAEADDAVARTAAEGFATGTVVFLDVEYMDHLPRAMRDYYSAWVARVLADGRYRPGIYVHTHNAATVYADVRAVFDSAGVRDEPPFWVAGGRAFSHDKSPADAGHAFAAVWQGMLDVVERWNGVALPIDVSVAAVASPSAAVAMATD